MDRLFYREGIHAVGIHRILDEARVTRVTLYRHFPSKDDLIVAYLDQRALRGEEQLEELAGRYDDPVQALLAIGRLLAEEGLDAEYRGCAFINAAAEFGDPSHPALAIVSRHRAWVRRQTAGLLVRAGRPEPERTAEALLMVRTGAVVGNSLDHSPDIDQTFLRLWHDVVTAA
ncbi:TetR/AcrR family transcriptional regulator [Actinomycetospora sp. TBRC 11914]|uniref:TetR/AcrR family transcriptional regulator n=1 Tax=Actinomycetospora sp. TBRC 11914 TaxID=2729387 RepID=UPI00145D31A3|nr:TetR/AcrR family transcriptional regulator [Actinomycetospora sp. TBRC 11914]NMO89504.1 helix-turn-helix transcriptional regulator [Actinomycetospora sp. TBRC 11914]